MKKKMVILGVNGMLGSEIMQKFSETFECIGITRRQCDITDESQVLEQLKKINPDIVINAAAFTRVDDCETELDSAFKINASGPKYIAQGCAAINAKFVHFSTDYIFDGSKDTAYLEDDLANPINQYGRSKLEGEKYIQEYLSDYLIIRTAWLFGGNGKNFVQFICAKAQQKEDLTIVNDQKGSPTYALDLVYAVELLLDKNASGVFHVTNSGSCSWFDFANEIKQQLSLDNLKISPVTSKEFVRPARRPANSVMDNSKFNKLTGFKMPDWKEALEKYLKTENISKAAVK